MDPVRTALAQATDTRPEDWYLAFRARYAMQQVCAALAATGTGRTVVTQALTCATAVDPILVEGLDPLYRDISAESFAIDPRALEGDDAWAALVIQHTFGVVDHDRSRALAAAARSRGALVIEDAAHALARMARDETGAPVADVSLHSFGSEKALPTKFGGAVWVNPDMASPLRDDLVRRLASLRAPGARLSLAARTYRAQLAVLRRLPAAVSGPLRRALVRSGLFDPPVAPAELAGGLAFSNIAASDWVVGQIEHHLPSLATLEATRRAAVGVYLEAFPDLVPGAATLAGQPLIRMPLLVPPGVDAEAVLAALRGHGIYAGSWYRPALFPGATDPAAYGYRDDDPALSETRDVIARIVNLPTGVDAAEAARIAGIARDVIDSARPAQT